jgi:hypothetical protein
MFDITPYVKLPKQQLLRYRILQIALFSVFLISAVLFAKELIFPTQFFNFNSAVDSLANTISKPYETPKGTGFHIFAYGQSDQAKITLTLPKDSPKLPKNTQILIRKSYLSFLSPINNKKYTSHIVKTYSNDNGYYIVKGEIIYPLISKNAFNSYLFKNNTAGVEGQMFDDIKKADTYIGFANATLISSKDSIYVIDGDTKHPIQDERAFEAMGYNYDNVISSNSEERSLHKKAKLYTVKSSHPFGTIFYAKDSKRTYIYDNNMLNKIQTTKIAKQHAIITEELSRTTIASCTLKKHLFSNAYSCTVSLDKIRDFAGNTYQFILKDAPSTDIKTTKIKLFTTISNKSLQQRTEAIKRKIDTIYN